MYRLSVEKNGERVQTPRICSARAHSAGDSSTWTVTGRCAMDVEATQNQTVGETTFTIFSTAITTSQRLVTSSGGAVASSARNMKVAHLFAYGELYTMFNTHE